MIRAAFFDVDGTLLSHASNCVPESARRALDLLRRQGVTVGLASGRSQAELDELPLDGLTFDVLLLHNGQMILDGEGGYLAGNPLEGEALERVIALFDAREVPVVLIERERTYINFVNADVVRAQSDTHTSVPPVGTYEGATVFQAMAYVDEGDTELLRSKLTGCDVTRWHPKAVDINAPSPGGKADGIVRWCEANGVDLSEVVAFGDADNDVTMLRAAGVGVAMGNAVPEAKEAADIVTTDIDDDGIWNSLALLGLARA